jgi:hypothetical protein
MANSSPLPPDLQRWADPIGSTGAMLCALHCAALPFLLVALPTLSLGFFGTSEFEFGFVGFATLLGTTSLWAGFRRHRRRRPPVLMALGLAAVWIGVTVPTVHDDMVAHAVVMSLGGALISVAHLLNFRLGQGHVHDASCSH